MKAKKEVIIFRKGKKVILRPVSKNDLNRCMVWFNDSEVTQYLGLSFPIYESEERGILVNRHKEKEKHVILAIETISGVHIGNIGLHQICWTSRVAWLGITIGDKNYWGKGYGTDAIMTLLDYAFQTLNLRKVCLAVLSSNERGQECYKKCGFKIYGRSKSHWYKNGQYVDEVLMDVFRKDL